MIDLPAYDPSNWQNSAQCFAEGIDPDRMAPETASAADLEQAKAVCGRCPVQVECLQDAKAQDGPFGVWGGRWFGPPPRVPDVVACRWCGESIQNAAGGRTRRFCSDSCRQRSARASRELASA